ncbi:hypothetical protein DIPPA_19184 [Diplonema papillatum]|nr:hypothetical protein DIPPA_19184 [Diplonema papillatum]
MGCNRWLRVLAAVAAAGWCVQGAAAQQACAMPGGAPEVAAGLDNTGFVTCHGQLSVGGAGGVRLVDERGEPVQLMGLGTAGLHLFPQCNTREAMAAVVAEWGVNVFRASMFVAEGGFADGSAFVKEKVKDIVQWAKELGIYVIIDWHVHTPGDPNAAVYQGAQGFFEEMSALYAAERHVLYEIVSEPNMVEWSAVKTYADSIIAAIRANDPKAIVIVGTTNWSQDVEIAFAAPVARPANVMYAFHFFAGTHTSLLDKFAAHAAKMPLFVTAFAPTDATGGGVPYLEDAYTFLEVARELGVSWVQWQYADGVDASSALTYDACFAKQWTAASCTGAFLRNYIAAHGSTCVGYPPVGSTPPLTTSSPVSNSIPVATAAGNPFAPPRRMYKNALFAQRVGAAAAAAADASVAERLEAAKDAPTSFWIDSSARIHGQGLDTAEGILADAALQTPAPVVTFVVHNLPNRDCDRTVTAGEICCYAAAAGGCDLKKAGTCPTGISAYKKDFIDELIFLLAGYQGVVPIVLIVEPGAIANLAAKRDDPQCGNLATASAYAEGIAYAVAQFHKILPEVAVYLDAGHSGLLGAPEAAQRYAYVVQSLGIVDKVRGFSTNVGSYQPTGTMCPALGFCAGNEPAGCCADPCGRLPAGGANNEANHVAVLSSLFPGKRFVVDTGRNGGATDEATCAHWCNVRDAAFGAAPTADANLTNVDALLWVKTPGVSDGCTSTLPDASACSWYDAQCGMPECIGASADEVSAPMAGEWFDLQAQTLAANAVSLLACTPDFLSCAGATCCGASQCYAIVLGIGQCRPVCDPLGPNECSVKTEATWVPAPAPDVTAVDCVSEGAACSSTQCCNAGLRCFTLGLGVSACLQTCAAPFDCVEIPYVPGCLTVGECSYTVDCCPGKECLRVNAAPDFTCIDECPPFSTCEAPPLSRAPTAETGAPHTGSPNVCVGNRGLCDTSLPCCEEGAQCYFLGDGFSYCLEECDAGGALECTVRVSTTFAPGSKVCVPEGDPCMPTDCCVGDAQCYNLLPGYSQCLTVCDEAGFACRLTQPTDVPSQAPPTNAPTAAPPTTAPPTSSPPTSAPPTSSPPTSAPPTSSPPTSAPPTSSPPTSAPPTSAPHTPAPPTHAPATPAPATEAPGGKCTLGGYEKCTAEKCCKDGYKCYVLTDELTLCLEKGTCDRRYWDCSYPTPVPATAAPTPSPTKPRTCKLFYSCTFDKECCVDGTRCYKQNHWYSQCLRQCPRGWDCNDNQPPPPAPTPVPTRAPPTPPSAKKCKLYHPCTTDENCCVFGTECYRQSRWYSQCLRECPYGWDCKKDEDTRTPVPQPQPPACRWVIQPWGNCQWARNCCATGWSCYEVNPWYAQCRRECTSRSWSCRKLC